MHKGWCPYCEESIEVDDEIAKDDDDQWGHERCVELERQGSRRVQS